MIYYYRSPLIGIMRKADGPVNADYFFYDGWAYAYSDSDPGISTITRDEYKEALLNRLDQLVGAQYDAYMRARERKIAIFETFQKADS
jgi:hypothetical protein